MFPYKVKGRPDAGEPGRRKRALRQACPAIGSRYPAMSENPNAFDFRKPVANDPVAKRAFHDAAYMQLRLLGNALALMRFQYNLRVDAGDITDSGQVILHSDRLYVQVSQPADGADTGILFRTCRSRRDAAGGENHYAPLELLNQPQQLARLIRQVCDV